MRPELRPPAGPSGGIPGDCPGLGSIGQAEDTPQLTRYGAVGCQTSVSTSPPSSGGLRSRCSANAMNVLENFQSLLSTTHKESPIYCEVLRREPSSSRRVVHER